MNETVKAALLAEREKAQKAWDYHARELASLRRHVAEHESEHSRQLVRFNAVSDFLRDNGVDLVAVDAEAEKARDETQRVVARNGLLTQDYGQSRSNLGNSMQQYAAGLNACNQFDPTAGLVKSLDEA